MKKTILILSAIILLVLSTCVNDNTGIGPLYDKLIGVWLVDLGTRPAEWPDTKYVFGSDQKFEIYHDTGLAYQGYVTSVDNQSIHVTPTFISTGDPLNPMVMCYILSNGDTTMELGWYSGQTPVYYLDLIKQ